jgi:uncharacterized protein YjbJ (UPF0337 family)
VLKQKWPKLTENDLQGGTVKHDELLGRILMRTGETRAAVEKAIENASSGCPPRADGRSGSKSSVLARNWNWRKVPQ